MGVHGQQRIFAFCIDKVASGKGSPDNLNGSYVCIFKGVSRLRLTLCGFVEDC